MSQNDVKATSWFAWPDDSWLIAWYNQHHTPEDIQDDEPASVAAPWMEEVQPLDLWGSLDEETERRLAPPEPTAFERLLEQRDRTREQILDDLAQEVVLAATACIEQAAQAEEMPPEWVSVILTDAGWEQYHTLARGPAETRPASPVSEEEPEQQPVEAAADHPSMVEELLWALRERYPQVTLAEPCEACGCEIWRPIAEFPRCCLRCLPPRGYDAFSTQVDAFYPRKKKGSR
ncbi:MAG TPA: hypothetical protein VKR06_17195 [Ktedonosporobacter sp.]|nr:hypothetical protein [Ktedonosporobacter sp.]